MRAATAHRFGDASVLGWDAARPLPPTRKAGQLLIRVRACSVSAGDKHILKGALAAVMKPKFPFIPGADVCGVVEEADASSEFKKGDVIIATFLGLPQGGMAERTLVDEKLASLKPAKLTDPESAAMLTSPITAHDAFKIAGMNPARMASSRALVIGGSGGVGSALVQILRAAGVGFVASVSSDAQLMESLGVDRNINYRETKFWEVDEFRREPFDVIFDCAGGPAHWRGARSGGVLKSAWRGGKFVAVIGDTTEFNIDRVYKLVPLAAGMLWRPVWTTFAPWVPKYKMVTSDPNKSKVRNIVEMVDRGELKPVMEPRGPFAFTEEGVRDAFEVLLSGHAHGKVVVDMEMQ